MKGLWKTAEGWHCEEGSESLKRAQEELLVKVQSSAARDLSSFGDSSAMG